GRSGTACWAAGPVQACQCSVLCAGTTGPVADAAPPAPVFPGCVLPAAGGAAWPEDEPPAEQAPTPSSAATVIAVAETQPLRPLWRPAAQRTATGEIDMSPIMPDMIHCIGTRRRLRTRSGAVPRA